MTHSNRNQLIISLEGETLHDVERLVDQLKSEVSTFLIGAPIFTMLGPDVIRMVRDHGGDVFLDLKYHDIPNTVARSVYQAAKLGVRMISIHASGGYRMMSEALKAVQAAANPSPKLIGVTVLTSMETLADIGVQYQVRDQVVRLAKLAEQVGLDGVMASPLEISPIRHACEKSFLIVTPGIRLAGENRNDQRRIAGPKEAIDAGANYLVVGRPIFESRNPQSTVKAILREMGSGES